MDRPDDITRRLDLLEQLVRDLPRQLHDTYLPRETYEADVRADGIQLRGMETEMRQLGMRLDMIAKDLRDEVTEREREMRAETKARESAQKERDREAAATRRLVWTSLAAPILVAIVTAILLGSVLQ